MVGTRPSGERLPESSFDRFVASSSHVAFQVLVSLRIKPNQRVPFLGVVGIPIANRVALELDADSATVLQLAFVVLVEESVMSMCRKQNEESLEPQIVN